MDTQDRTNRIFRLATIFALILIALFIVLAVASSIKHRGQAKINIHVMPDDSHISIDGNSSKRGTVYTTPGEHTFSAARDGFATDNEYVSVSKKTTTDVYLAPTPNSTAGQQWVNDHADQEKIRQQYAHINIDGVQRSLSNKYPIVKELPLDTVYYSISYGPSKKYPNDPSKIAVYITATQDNRAQALHWMKYKGFDPANYEIIYQSP